MSIRKALTALAVLSATLLAGCVDPDGPRPGLWLSGDIADNPSDCSFAHGQREIEVEVPTPYLLPHSVTIWCGVVEDELHVAASAPDTKRWPGWADGNPDVRIRIEDQVYEVRLTPLEDPDEVDEAQYVWAEKYDQPYPAPEGTPLRRFWRVGPRA